MSRVLYIGAGVPWAGGAGYLIRQNLLLRALAEVAEVHLAMFDHPVGAAPPPFAASVTRLVSPGRASSPSRWKSLTDDLFSPLPRTFRGYDLSASRHAVAALSPASFDAVVAYRIDFAHFAGVLGQPRLILDIDDPEHIRWQRRLLATTGGKGDWRTRYDLLKLRRFERHAVARAKMAFVCQSQDALGLPAPAGVVQVVPNCVEVPPDPQRAEEEPRVLFVGNCAGSPQSPNLDAVQWFLKEIWPTILREIPTATFDLVGATSEPLKKQAESTRGVAVLGFVDDLAGVYARSAISVAPIRFGTGTRVKILESFAHACPVVATSVGAEGIDAEDGRQIAMADDAPSFAKRCVGLLRDREARQRIGQAGYALARQSYDRAVQHERLVQVFGDFLLGRSIARPRAEISV